MNQSLENAIKTLKFAHINHSNLDITEGDLDIYTAARHVFFDFYKNPKNIPVFLNYIPIVDIISNDILPFGELLKYTQRRVIEQFIDLPIGVSGLAIPKPRQDGITTLTNALALWDLIFTNNAYVAVIASKSDNAKENLQRIKDMFNDLPGWIKFMFYEFDEKGRGHAYNKTEWSFLNKFTGNKAQAHSVSGIDGVRGKPVTFLHWTEVASTEYAEDIFQSVWPAIQKSRMRRGIFESTGKGPNNLYAEMIMGEKKGIQVCFIAWWENPDNVNLGAVLNKKQRERIILKHKLKEIELTDSQLSWYDDIIASYKKNPIKGYQEFPTTITDVITSTSRSFFSSNTIEMINVTTPIDDSFGVGTSRFNMDLFADVEEGYNYVIGCDTSEGDEEGDFTCFYVMDPFKKIVAKYRNRVSFFNSAEHLYRVAQYFNNASILVERAGSAWYVLCQLIDKYKYENILYDEKGKPGIQMHMSNKPYAINLLEENITTGKSTYYDKQLVDEMRTFTNKLKAQPGAKDDSVMAAAITEISYELVKPEVDIHTTTEWADKLLDRNQNNGLADPFDW